MGVEHEARNHARNFIQKIDDKSAEPAYRLMAYLYCMAIAAESPETCPHLRDDVRKIIADAMTATGVTVPAPLPAAVATFTADSRARRLSLSAAACDRYTFRWVDEFVRRHVDLVTALSEF